MDFRAVFYVPLFLRAHAPGDIPKRVAFFRTGLEAGEPASAGQADSSVLAAEAAFAARLPLSPGEARAALAEMLALGRDRAEAGVLFQQAARERLSLFSREEQGPGELAALELFSRAGDSVSCAADAPAIPDIRRALVECHKTLLLAQALEKGRVEIADLTERSLRGEKSLRAVFEEGGDAASFFPAALSPSEDSPPWRSILDAALPFIPEKALLFTADPRMARDLQDAGMLQPFPEDLAVLCADWPEETLAGLLLAELPAWRLVGRRFLPPDRPWLARDVEVLVARPGTGRPDASAPKWEGGEE